MAELLGGTGLAVAPGEVARRLDAIRAAHGAVLIADEWAAPSGLVVLHWHPTLEGSRPVARITTLLVGADERRRGLGRALLKAAAQAAQVAGCEDLEVAVRADQPELRAFCAGTGFTETGARFLRALRKKG